MTSTRTKSLAWGMWTLPLTLLAVSELRAQRLVLPEGSVYCHLPST